jgi:hypothetical protein
MIESFSNAVEKEEDERDPRRKSNGNRRCTRMFLFWILAFGFWIEAEGAKKREEDLDHESCEWNELRERSDEA